MKTKIVYVLVSAETDYFYEMVLLSLYSFRLYHPKDTVELVMDEATYERLVDKKATILNDVIPIVVSIPSEYSQMQRSRYLKTQLRQIVKGDFLYLDSDTLVCDSLEEIDNTYADIAMVIDRHGKALPSSVIDLRRNAGFRKLDNEPYFNSGVIYAKESNRSYELFREWHILWKQSVCNGVFLDQPALCQANVESAHIIKELDAVWNCQLYFVNPEQLNKAKVFHYFTNRETMLKHLLLEHIRRVGTVDEHIAKVAQFPFSMGYAVLSMSDKRTIDYLYSDLLSVYDGVPKLYRLLVSVSRKLVAPIKAMSGLKNTFQKR